MKISNLKRLGITIIETAPSDFSRDSTTLPAGQNRNFDLRRESHQHLHHAGIAYTSILNDAFAEILAHG